MTQEDKDLLLKDLCGRLPYGVKFIDSYDDIYKTVSISWNKIEGYLDYNSRSYYFEDIKPYLFPMSSMTEEQDEELKNIYYSYNGMFQYAERIFDRIPFNKMKYFPYQIEEFFNKNHIDYRGLIDKGLALDATNKNIY